MNQACVTLDVPCQGSMEIEQDITTDLRVNSSRCSWILSRKKVPIEEIPQWPDKEARGVYSDSTPFKPSALYQVNNNHHAT